MLLGSLFFYDSKNADRQFFCATKRLFGRERTAPLGPLYKFPWYFSASVMQAVWPFHSAGELKVVLQSMHVKDEWHWRPWVSSLGFFTTSEHAA